MKKIMFIFCMVSVLLMAVNASADSISFQLSTPNTGLNGFPTPYADVTVNRTSSTTATITFAGDSSGGYQYYIGAAQATDVNVNASSFTPSNLTGYVVKVQPPFPKIGSGTADGFGSFNLTIDNFDGATSAALSLSFDLTDISGTWASASDVLTPNLDGHLAAAHIFVTGNGDNGGPFTLGSSPPTGFASDGPPPIPEPATMLLLGSGLIGLAGLARKRFKK